MKRGVDYIGVSVGAIILNDKGEVLLTKRSNKTRNEHGKWEAPGGGVEFGELRQDAIKREIKEELGVDIEIIDILKTEDEILTQYNQHWVPTTYIVQIKKGQTPKIIEPDKCDEIGWFNLNHLPEPLSYITQVDLQAFSQRINRGKNHKKEGKFMVAVGAVVEHVETGNILVIKRSDNADFSGGIWELITGRMKQFEEVRDAVIREVKEECGLDIEIVKPINTFHVFRGEQTAENEVIGITHWVTAKQSKVILSAEHTDYKWLIPQEAVQFITHQNIRKDIEAFMKAKGL